MAAQTPTPSSEIIHLTTTYVDALESLPPALTRSLSDLKELDAVLSGAYSTLYSPQRASLVPPNALADRLNDPRMQAPSQASATSSASSTR